MRNDLKDLDERSKKINKNVVCSFNVSFFSSLVQRLLPCKLGTYPECQSDCRGCCPCGDCPNGNVDSFSFQGSQTTRITDQSLLLRKFRF